MGEKRGLAVFERYLSIWVILCIVSMLAECSLWCRSELNSLIFRFSFPASSG